MRVLRAFTLAAAAVSTVGAIAVACSDNNSTGIPAGLEVYTATLNGANEAPTPVTTTATGHAIVTILGDSLVSWEVIIDTPIDSIILGHIHRHAADSVAGNVQINFAPPATGLGFTGTATIGSSAPASPADSILAIIRAGRAYVNIHTKAHTGGEIRGTLVKQ
jgi:CHRD domain-containing protein